MDGREVGGGRGSIASLVSEMNVRVDFPRRRGEILLLRDRGEGRGGYC